MNRVCRGCWDGESLDDLVTVAPGTGWGIFSEEEETHCDRNNDDEGNDESHAPCDVWSKTSVMNEGVEDGGHNEVLHSMLVAVHTIELERKLKLTVIPPPELPHPPAKALAVPTTFLSKKPVHQTWHGTNEAPKIPTKNRSAIKPFGVLTKPAIAVGRDPPSRHPMKTYRGPNRSQSGPAIKRITNVPARPMTLELAKSTCVIFKSVRIVLVSSGAKAYLPCPVSSTRLKEAVPCYEMMADAGVVIVGREAMHT